LDEQRELDYFASNRSGTYQIWKIAAVRGASEADHPAVNADVNVKL